MLPQTLILDAYTLDDYAEGPNAVKVELTKRDLRHIWYLAYLVQRHHVAAIHDYDPTPVWGDVDTDSVFTADETIDLSIDGVRLVVADRAFYYTGYLRHSTIEVETRGYELQTLGKPPFSIRLRLTLVNARTRIRQTMRHILLKCWHYRPLVQS